MGQLVGGVGVQEAVGVTLGVPLRPLPDLLLQQGLERLGQGGYRQGRGGLDVAAEAEAQRALARQGRGQGHVSRPGGRIAPAEGAVAVEVLPAVADAHVTGAGVAERVPLVWADGCQRQAERPLLGP